MNTHILRVGAAEQHRPMRKTSFLVPQDAPPDGSGGVGGWARSPQLEKKKATAPAAAKALRPTRRAPPVVPSPGGAPPHVSSSSSSSSATSNVRRVHRCEQLKRGGEYTLDICADARETAVWSFATQTTPVIFGVRFNPDGGVEGGDVASRRSGGATWVVGKREYAAQTREQSGSFVAPCAGTFTLSWGGKSLVTSSMGGGGSLSLPAPVRVTIKQAAVAALIVDVDVVASPCIDAQWRELWCNGQAAAGGLEDEASPSSPVFLASCSLEMATLDDISALKEQFAECERLVVLSDAAAPLPSGVSGAVEIAKKASKGRGVVQVDELATWLLLRLDTSLKQLPGASLAGAALSTPLVSKRIDQLWSRCQAVLWSTARRGQRAALWIHAVSAVTKAARVAEESGWSSAKSSSSSYYAELTQRAEAADRDGTNTEWERVAAEIDRDIARTMPNDVQLPRGGERREVLRRILRAYAVHCPAVAGSSKGGGYTQGVNVLLAMGLRTGMAEEAAFYFLTAVLEDVLPSYNHPSLQGLMVDLEIFELIFNKCLPAIAKKLTALDVKLEWCTSSMFMCIFANNLPAHVAELLWDLALVFGRTRVVFAATLAVLEMVGVELLCATSRNEAMTQVMLAVTMFRHLPGVEEVVAPAASASAQAAPRGSRSAARASASANAGEKASGDSAHTCRDILRSTLYWSLHFTEDEIAALRHSMLQRLETREARKKLRNELQREEAEASKAAEAWDTAVQLRGAVEETLENALRLLQMHHFLDARAGVIVQDGAVVAGERAIDHVRALLQTNELRAAPSSLQSSSSSSSSDTNTARSVPPPRNSSSTSSPSKVKRFVNKLVGRSGKAAAPVRKAAQVPERPTASHSDAAAVATDTAATSTAGEAFGARMDSDDWRRKRARSMQLSISSAFGDESVVFDDAVGGADGLDSATSLALEMHDDSLLATAHAECVAALQLLLRVCQSAGDEAAPPPFINDTTARLAQTSIIEMRDAVAAARDALTIAACAAAVLQKMDVVHEETSSSDATTPRELLLALVTVEKLWIEFRCIDDDDAVEDAAASYMVQIGVACDAAHSTELRCLLSTLRDEITAALLELCTNTSIPRDAALAAVRSALLLPAVECGASKSVQRDAVDCALRAAQQMKTMLRGKGPTATLLVSRLQRRVKVLAKEMGEWGNSRRRSVALVKSLVRRSVVVDGGGGGELSFSSPFELAELTESDPWVQEDDEEDDDTGGGTAFTLSSSAPPAVKMTLLRRIAQLKLRR